MTAKKRGNSRYFFFLLTSGIVLLVAFFGGRYLICTTDYFTIEKIEVVGNDNLETDFLYNLVKDLLGRNLHLTKNAEIASRFENVVRVKDVSIARTLPGKLRITIKERVGRFFLRTAQGTVFTLDAEGMVLDNDNFYEGENFPIITTTLQDDEVEVGAFLHDAFVDSVYSFCDAVLAVEPTFFNTISEIYRHDDDLYLVEMLTGYKIIFGDGDLERKIKQYRFLEQNAIFEKNRIVDLRFADQLVIRPEE